MLEKLRLRQFCCCCTLKTGSLVIGTLGWLFSLLNATTIESYRDVPSQDELPEDIGDGHVETLEKERGNALSICTVILSFCLSVALVIGVYRDDRRLMLPWLCVKFLEMIMVYIFTLVLFFAMFVALPASVFVLLFFIMLLISAGVTYCFLCVWSLYQDLGETMATLQPMTAQEIQMVEQGGYDNQVDVGWKQPPLPPQEMV